MEFLPFPQARGVNAAVSTARLWCRPFLLHADILSRVSACHLWCLHGFSSLPDGDLLDFCHLLLAFTLLLLSILHGPLSSIGYQASTFEGLSRKFSKTVVGLFLIIVSAQDSGTSFWRKTLNTWIIQIAQPLLPWNEFLHSVTAYWSFQYFRSFTLSSVDWLFS